MANWLDDLGLGQYAEPFEKNGVDSRAVRLLTERDLETLGVLLGHRRILMAAIAELNGNQVKPAGPSTAEAERRQLTVMFCDLVGSTEMSTELDVEDYRELIRAFHEASADVVSRFDGFLAKFMGDGLLAYFGYPIAHDDDAQRAIRAGLEIVDEAIRRKPVAGRRPAVRVGIATGEAVVGDLVVHGLTEAASVLGVTPNLAARLQTLANANEIVVSDATRLRLRDNFVVDDLGEVSLKGIREPTRAWRVRGVSQLKGETATNLLFVGRRNELACLADSWQGAKAGKLQIVRILGQAGIGKSRLVREFLYRNPEARTMTWICSPYHKNTPLHPVPPDLLPRTPAEIVGGEAQRRALFDSVALELSRRAGAAPLMMFVEDSHWLDPTTTALLQHLVDRLSDRAVMLVVASRPDPAAGSSVASLGGSVLELGALDSNEAEALVDTISVGTLRQSLRREVLGRAGGLPLFLEELTRVVVQGGAGAIPVSLQDSLQARLDALGSAKRVAQFASAIGRTFSKADLQALSGFESLDLQQALDRLLADDVLVESDGLFAFRHVVIQDVAYQSLLRSSRRRIHGEIADHAMHQGNPPSAEYLARHLSGAGRQVEAAPRWREAGRYSAALWAHAEACAHYHAALQDGSELAGERWELEVRLELVESLRILDRYDEALAELDRAEELARQVGQDQDLFRIHLLRGSILFPLGQAEGCIAAQARALDVARKMRDPHSEARALSGLADAHFAGKRIATAERTYDACVRLAEANGLETVTLANLSLRGHMRLYLCRIDEARADCERAVEMSVKVGDRRAEIMARGSCLGKVLMESGEFSRADEEFADAGRLAAEIGAHRYEALNLLFRGKIALETGSREEGLAYGRQAVVLSQQAGPRFCLPLALGVVARAETSAEACQVSLKRAEELIASGCLTHNPLWFFRDAALAAVAHGRPDQARRYAEALRDTFALEQLPWCELVAAGVEALASWLETGDRVPVGKVVSDAAALGFVGWSHALANATSA